MVTVRKLLAFLLSVSILIPCAAGSYQAASIERAEISYSDTENYSKVFWLDEMEQNVGSGGKITSFSGTVSKADEASLLFGIERTGQVVEYNMINAIDNIGQAKWDGYLEKYIDRSFDAGKYKVYVLCQTSGSSAAARAMSVTINDIYYAQSSTIGESEIYASGGIYILPMSFTLDGSCDGMNIRLQAPEGASAPNFIAMAIAVDYSVYTDFSFNINGESVGDGTYSFGEGTYTLCADYFTEDAGGTLIMDIFENGALKEHIEQNEYSGQIPEYLIEKECELDEYHTGFSVKVYYTDTGGKTTDLREVTEKLYREDKSNLSAPDKGDYIGFIGDSITHADDTALASYEDIIYEYYITHYPDKKITMKNLGISSATAADFLKGNPNLLEKYISLYPDMNKVYIMLGMNDIDGKLYSADVYDEDPDSDNYISRMQDLEQYKTEITEMVSFLQSEDISVILIIPSIYEQTKSGVATSRKNDGLIAAGEILKEIAEEYGCYIADLNSPMLMVNHAIQADNPSGSILDRGDLVHPGKKGYNFMAYTMLRQHGADNVANYTANYAEKPIKFEYTPYSMAMYKTEGYELADEYCGLTEDLNTEMLKVNDLPDGKYKVRIDSKLLGTYSSAELENGINIAGLTANPTYSVSKQINALNMEKSALECTLQLQLRYETIGKGSNNTELDTDEEKSEYIGKINEYTDKLYSAAQSAAKPRIIYVWERNEEEPEVVEAGVYKEFFVSPNGSDTNDGLTDKTPFATIQMARDNAAAISDDMTGNIIINIMEGAYYQDETIAFSEKDSGKNGYKVIYRAYEGQQVSISGGTLVTGWSQYDGNIYKAKLNRDSKLRSLYVNGERKNMTSREIKAKSLYGEYGITAGEADWAWSSGTKTDGMVYSTSDFPDTINPEDVEIESSTTWNSYIVCVDEIATSKDESERIVTMQQPGGAIAQNGASGAHFKPSGTNTVRNVFEFMDEPGEF